MWEDGTIWDGARAGKLLLRSCKACGELCHPPLPMCPHCQSLEWEPHAVSGTAALVSWLVSVHPADPGADARIVIVVRLAEGVNFVSNLIGASVEELCEGMPLDVCFEPSGDTVLPLFRPAGVGR